MYYRRISDQHSTNNNKKTAYTERRIGGSSALGMHGRRRRRRSKVVLYISCHSQACQISRPRGFISDGKKKSDAGSAENSMFDPSVRESVAAAAFVQLRLRYLLCKNYVHRKQIFPPPRFHFLSGWRHEPGRTSDNFQSFEKNRLSPFLNSKKTPLINEF